MSKRNWLLNRPVGVGLAVVALLIGAGVSARYQQHSSCGDGTATQHLGTEPCNLQITGVPPIRGHESPPRNPEPKRDEWREESDLEAQWKMANWALMTAIAACLSLFVTTAGVLYVKQTLEATRAAVAQAEKANETVRAMGEAQVRAYVVPSEVGVEVEDLVPVLHVTLYNSGNSPAFEVQIMCSVECTLNTSPRIGEPTRVAGTLSGTLRQGHSAGRQRLHTGRAFDLFQKPINGRVVLLATVIVSYRDVFKKRQEDVFYFRTTTNDPLPGEIGPMVPHHDFHFS